MRIKELYQYLIRLALALLSIPLFLFGINSCGENKVNDSERSEIFFNGVNLKDWIGDTTIWKAKDGMLIGSTMKDSIDHAIWITTEKNYSDFELTMSVKLVGDANKNSGV